MFIRNIKKFYLFNFLFVISLSSGTVNAQSISKSILIHSSQGETMTNCHATIIKYDSQCHYFTNFHCKGENNRFYGNIDGVGIQFTIEKYDASIDLAKLEPDLEHNNLCEGLEETDLTIPSLVSDSLSDVKKFEFKTSSDYLKSGEKQAFGNFPLVRLGDGFIPRLVFYESFWFENQATFRGRFMTLNEIEVKPGMSGSPLIADLRSGKQIFVGILSQYIPFLSKAVFIKPNAIKEFVESSSTTENSPYYYSSNRNNYLTNSGGNAYANVGDSFFIKKTGNEYIENFYEPQEGVRLESDQILLGIADYQIDGWDDYDFVKSHIGERSFLEDRVFKGEYIGFTAIKQSLQNTVNQRNFGYWMTSIFSEDKVNDDSLLEKREYKQLQINITYDDLTYSINMEGKIFKINFKNNIAWVTDQENQRYECQAGQFKKMECFLNKSKYFSISFSNDHNNSEKSTIRIRQVSLLEYEKVELNYWERHVAN